MSLLAKKIDNLRKMPEIETKISKSKDGKWLIHKTIITDIRAVELYETVLGEDKSQEERFLIEKPVFDGELL